MIKHPNHFGGLSTGETEHPLLNHNIESIDDLTWGNPNNKETSCSG